MAGMTFCLADRGIIGTWSIITGTAVTANPIANLNDWKAGNQAHVTAAGAVVRVLCDLGAAPSSAGNTDWTVNCFGLVNHNCDSEVLTVKSHTANDYSLATTRLAATTLDTSMDNPNLLVTFAGTAARYWWLNISSVSADPAKIGRIVFGYAVDMGYPIEGWPSQAISTGAIATTPTGNMIGGRFTNPTLTKQFRFEEQASVTRHVVYNPAVANATTYPTYSTIRRFFSVARQYPINAPTTLCGLTAGSGIPMLYHEGDAVGISSAGRPAYYGTIAMDNLAMQQMPTATPVNFSITDCNDAHNRQIQPPTN